MQRIRKKIKEETTRNQMGSTINVVERVNRMIKGWQQYYDNISMGTTRNKINRYVQLRTAKFISKRNKSSKIKWKLFQQGELYDKYGLYYMRDLKRKFA